MEFRRQMTNLMRWLLIRDARIKYYESKSIEALSSLITHCSTTRRRKGSMTSADLAKSRHRTSDDPPRGRSRSTSGDLPNPYWNLRSPPTNLPRRGRGPSTDLADLRAQISSISNPPVSIDDTADCNLELRVGMSVT